MHIYYMTACIVRYRKMDNKKYVIAEFDDGLQLIPAIWFNANTSSSIWSSHFKTKFRINKAIVTREIPQHKSDWKELPIKKVFGIASKNNVTHIFVFINHFYNLF